MLGDRLRCLRKKYNLSQDRLGELAGVSREQISRYENGKALPDFATMMKIADVLRASIDYLAGRTDTNLLFPSEPENSPEKKEQASPSFRESLPDEPEKETPFSTEQLQYLNQFKSEIVEELRKDADAPRRD